MNEELITLNEVLNDGSQMYFYQLDCAGLWVAYGYSAYLLAHQENVRCQSSFSEQMQMPCACMTAADFKKQILADTKAVRVKDGCYRLPSGRHVEPDSYQAWTNSLK